MFLSSLLTLNHGHSKSPYSLLTHSKEWFALSQPCTRTDKGHGHLRLSVMVPVVDIEVSENEGYRGCNGIVEKKLLFGFRV